MSLNEAIYASCGLAFLVLIALMLVRGRISGPGIVIAVACALTVSWAAWSAMAELLPRSGGSVLDSLRLSAWLIVMVLLIAWRDRRRRGSASLPFLLAIGFSIAAVGYEVAILVLDPAIVATTRQLHDFLRVGLGILGLVAAENLLRNADAERRRDLWPLCLALGATFAFELFLYADRLMLPGATPILAGGRGLVGLVSVPLLAVAMARNRVWQINIHVSRAVVFHTAALVATGAFFLALAAIGVLVREFGGAWAPLLQVLTLLGSAVVLILVLGARGPYVGFKHFIARHFFTNRYDYREEWLRFVTTVSRSGTGEELLPVRIIRALAQIVDSPSGSLWLWQDEGVYIPEAAWNLPVEAGRKLSKDDALVVGFKNGTWIQEPSSRTSDRWFSDPAQAWLAVPLPHDDVMIAFVVLAPPPHSYPLDWESFDLLRAAGRQAASYLAEERSTRALLDSRLLNDYSKRFAFVVHDLKNLASQLSLIVSNARRYLEEPEFREDMLLTLEDSIARMNRLIARLHSQDDAASAQVVEPDLIIAHFAQELSRSGTPIETRLGAPDCRVAINRDQLHSVLSHLINNAQEASRSAARVVVASHATADRLMIDVIDNGPGMDEDFVRNQLFRPFRTTKSGGLGIGAYQTRELLRMVGADLEVISKKGVGTTMRMTFPVHRDPQSSSAAAA